VQEESRLKAAAEKDKVVRLQAEAEASARRMVEAREAVKKRAVFVEEQRQQFEARELAGRLRLDEEGVENSPTSKKIPLYLDLDKRRVFVVDEIGAGGQGSAYLVRGYDASDVARLYVVKKVCVSRSYSP